MVMQRVMEVGKKVVEYVHHFCSIASTDPADVAKDERTDCVDECVKCGKPCNLEQRYSLW